MSHWDACWLRHTILKTVFKTSEATVIMDHLWQHHLNDTQLVMGCFISEATVIMDHLWQHHLNDISLMCFFISEATVIIDHLWQHHLNDTPFVMGCFISEATVIMGHLWQHHLNDISLVMVATRYLKDNVQDYDVVNKENTYFVYSELQKSNVSEKITVFWFYFQVRIRMDRKVCKT